MRAPTALRLLSGTLALSGIAAGGCAWAAGERALPDKGVNILVAGLDSRTGLSARQRDQYKVGGQACKCTDTLMLVHLSADGERASVVSLPRDSYVRFAPHADPRSAPHRVSHHGKINAAHAHGGEQLTVRTVEQATGIDIHHYLGTDIRGFIRTVDRLGGTKVCTREPLNDRSAGLSMPPGAHHVQGKDAIRYVRARYIEGLGDIGRVRRQQRFVANLAGDKIREGAFADSAKFAGLLTALLKDVRTSRHTGFADLARIGWHARHLKIENVEFATVPVSSIGYNARGWGSSVKWSDQRSAQLFRALRDDRPMRTSDRRTPGSLVDNFGKTVRGSTLLCT